MNKLAKKSLPVLALAFGLVTAPALFISYVQSRDEAAYLERRRQEADALEQIVRQTTPELGTLLRNCVSHMSKRSDPLAYCIESVEHQRGVRLSPPAKTPQPIAHF